MWPPPVQWWVLLAGDPPPLSLRGWVTFELPSVGARDVPLAGSEIPRKTHDFRGGLGSQRDPRVWRRLPCVGSSSPLQNYGETAPPAAVTLSRSVFSR